MVEMEEGHTRCVGGKMDHIVYKVGRNGDDRLGWSYRTRRCSTMVLEGVRRDEGRESMEDGGRLYNPTHFLQY